MLIENSSQAQGNFVNLDFESANVPNGTSPGPISVANALPGWTVYYGTSQVSQIYYNDVSLGSSQVTLISSSDPFGADCVTGNYGVLLQGGSTYPSVSIGQSGLVPAGSMSVLFDAQLNPAFGPVYLSLGGQNIAYSAVTTEPYYTVYGGNIPSSLAGQVETLEFVVPGSVSGYNGDNALNLGPISFSLNEIPEPGSWALML